MTGVTVFTHGTPPRLTTSGQTRDHHLKSSNPVTAELLTGRKAEINVEED